MSRNTPAQLARLTKSNLDEAAQQQLPKIPARVSATRKKIRKICNSLSQPSAEFEPSKTVAVICDLLHSAQYLSRILYSELSNYLFSLSDQERGTFDTNTEKLLQYIDEQGTEKEAEDFVIRIYDHCQLAKAQIGNVDHMLKVAIEEAKKNIETESKKLEKEYISILGIFASVVLAFIGGSMFSTSVLDNIASANIYRTIFIVDFLAFVVISLVYLLLRFIMHINGAPQNVDGKNFFPIKMLYITCLLVGVLDILAWGIDFGNMARFFTQWLPWTP